MNSDAECFLSEWEGGGGARGGGTWRRIGRCGIPFADPPKCMEIIGRHNGVKNLLFEWVAQKMSIFIQPSETLEYKCVGRPTL